MKTRPVKTSWTKTIPASAAQLSWDVSDSFNAWFSYRKDDIDEYTNGLIAQGILITPYKPDAITQDGFFYSEQYQWGKKKSRCK